MKVKCGTILKSISSEEEDYFDEAVVLIVAQNAGGETGLVLNRPFGRQLTELDEFKEYHPSIELYEGGPMEQDHLYFIHKMKDTSVGGSKVLGNVFLGGDFTKALELIQTEKEPKEAIKIFVGYCGWDGGQLEDEITNGGWAIDPLEDILQ